MYHQENRDTALGHYLRTGQRLGGFEPNGYKAYELCDLCGGTVRGLDVKGIRSERNSRYRDLYAQYQAAKAAGKSHKIWQIRGGITTRPSHKSANGQKVGIDEDFQVGDAQMFLPNDPDAPLNETANCRCSVKYVREGTPVWPTKFNNVRDRFTHEIKPRPGGPNRPHTAIDIRNFLGQPVYAILDGNVIKVSTNFRTGNNFIKIKHNAGLESSYSHTKSNVNEGEIVTAGQIIGHSDGSGTSDGQGDLAPHLHFVLRRNGRRIDPLTILKIPSQTD